MPDYCAVVVRGSENNGHTVVVHQQWCGGVMEDMCEWLMLGRRVVLARLDGDNKVSVGVELKVITGDKKCQIVYHKCDPRSPETAHYRMSSGGGLIIGNSRKDKQIVCTYCGTANTTLRVGCVTCGKSLWAGLSERMAEYNRRLREGLRDNNKQLSAVAREMIQRTVDLFGHGHGWFVDENGYAKETPVVREKLKKEYAQEDIDRYEMQKRMKEGEL